MENSKEWISLVNSHFQVGKTHILAMPKNVLDIPDPQGDHLLVPNDQQPFGGESRG